MFESIIVLVATKFHYLVITGAVVTWLYTKPVQRRKLVILSVVSLPTAYVIGRAASWFVDSPRPFVAHDLTPLFAHAADNGFPSEHALFAFTISALVYTVNKPLGISLFVVSGLIGTARVLANVHHTIDVFGGLLIGMAVVYAAQKMQQQIKSYVVA